ncbi:putative Transcriptional regulator, TetR family [Nostocoides japonicum T1-X7]|uniref:Putative Transcriptional regulator, TetR family n=1 Tax=Nostocoides japonicum T1-X7 TaxID=1194083 RepID=A0A077M130_9MICO|nr:TetR/AcrR family transcriptional regulator [Tetrasphaera japonica]CCH77915.1 putative Transcriptional regulator, TetR family [Tetrasphaera japonica T1-X7]
MPRDGSATRERILETAERLVIDNGFAATSVDRVIAESHSSKGSFFHHFASKNDLARALVERYAAADVAHLHAALEHARAATDDPAKRVVAFLSYFENDADAIMSAQSSCLYVSILTERDLVLDGTSGQIEEAVVAWRDGFAELLRAALPGRTPAGVDIDVDALSDHVFVTFEGAFLLCRSTGDSGHMHRQLTVLRHLMEALLGAVAATPPRRRRAGTPSRH